MEQQYFTGIKVGDKVWVAGIGEVGVYRLNNSRGYPISLTGADYNRHVNYAGIEEGRTLQTTFWSEPVISIPSRPKRMMEKKGRGVGRV